MTRESDRALRRALRPAPGMMRLVLLRASFLLVCALPGMLGAFSSLAGGPARQPYFTEAVRPLPALPFVRLVGDIAPALLALLGVGLLCALLVDQLLTAGGLALLGPAPESSRPRVYRTVMQQGLSHLWPFLRLLVLVALAFLLGAAGLRRVFTQLVRSGGPAGYSAATLWLVLPALQVLATFLWLAVVGAWSLFARALTVADGRRVTRRTLWLAVRVLARCPLRGLLLFVLTTATLTLLGGAYLVAWRQLEPREGLSLAAWLFGGLGLAAAQAALWAYWLRAARLLYAGARFDDLRAQPDAPFGLVRALRRALRPRGAGGSVPGDRGLH